MRDFTSQLDRLHDRFDATTARPAAGGNSTAVHGAILGRLAANRSRAEAAGWSECSLVRDGGSGRLRLIGVPPGERDRREVPDAPV